MSGGHWNYQGAQTRDALECVGLDAHVIERWPRVARAFAALAAALYDAERTMDFDLSFDNHVPDDAAFERLTITALLTAVVCPARESPRCLRMRYRRLGGHMHCRLFSATRPDTTFAPCGELVFGVDEWPDVCALLGPVIEILPEEA